MPATIDFTDSIGSATLTVLGGVLNNWTPDALPVDDAAVRLGSGQVDSFTFRERCAMRFEAPLLNSAMSVAVRLMKHLWSGGTCTINTGDRTPTPLVYTDMGIGTQDGQRIAPELIRVDRATVDYQLTLTVEYVGSGAVPLPIVLY